MIKREKGDPDTTEDADASRLREAAGVRETAADLSEQDPQITEGVFDSSRVINSPLCFARYGSASIDLSTPKITAESRSA